MCNEHFKQKEMQNSSADVSNLVVNKGKTLIGWESSGGEHCLFGLGMAMGRV